MSRTVLFAGGPLHGKTMAVDAARAVCVAEPAKVILEPHDPSDLFPGLRTVTYTVSKFAMCGRIVWIGHLSYKPDNDLVFEVLTSDGAKAAVANPEHP